MREVAIVSPVRTPVGRFGGTLRDIPAEDLGALVIREAVSRSGVDPEKIDEVVLGHGYSSGENPAIGRLCAMKADLPLQVTGYQLDRRCSSGLQAILNAAMLVQTDNADVVIAGGAESMSGVEYYTLGARWGGRFGNMNLYDRLIRSREASTPEERFGYINGMIETAQNVANYYEISREEQDEYSLRSHQRAVAASEDDKFKDEIVPVPVPQRRGPPVMFEADEGPRKDSSMESLAKLRPLMKDGSVTAGNSSSQNDAASVCLVVAADKLDELGLEPMAYLKGWASAGVHPAYMGVGPVPAVNKLFARTGYGWKDVDLIELNEAFASQVLSVIHQWQAPRDDIHDILNVNGSGISLGHPIAATGARILATMLHEMKRRDAKLGLETMCVGGGQGVAALFELAA